MRDRHRRRLDRQFRAMSRAFPKLKGAITRLNVRRGVLVRVPLGIALLIGGLLSILPFLGLWMIPLGLMVLAIDLPLLRPAVSAGIIRLRRRWSVWRRNRPNGPGGPEQP
jgi:hypothetical protein